MASTIRTVHHQDGDISYTFTRKSVKNLNIRVTREGSILVSAPNRVALRDVDAFVLSRADWIARALQGMSQQPIPQSLPKRDAKACQAIFLPLVAEIIPEFTAYGVTMPQVTARTMKSRWGSCSPRLGKITLNTRLLDYPDGCLRMVIVHELCHFVHPNHGKGFYTLLARHCPDWHKWDALLKKQPE